MDKVKMEKMFPAEEEDAALREMLSHPAFQYLPPEIREAFAKTRPSG